MTDRTKQIKVAIAVIVAAAIIALGLKALKPKAKKARAKPPLPIVSVLEAMPSEARVTIEANGTVIPARKVEVAAEVEGTAIYVNPALIPGGLIPKGSQVVRIDPADYDLDIRNKKALVAEARLNLELEQAQQNIARKEWEELKGQGSISLALREPQIKNALAKLDAAESSLEAAKLARERTTITAPFDALVLGQNATRGQLITRQKTVATLVDTGEFWVEASLPLSRLSRIVFPEQTAQSKGTPAELTMSLGSGMEIRRMAEAYRLQGELDPKGKMAKVLFRLVDPLCLNECDDNASKVLLGSFVTLKIDAGAIEGAYAIPRSAIRDNNTLWIMDSQDKLEVRPVEVAWHREADVLVTGGLNPGDRVVLSSLQSPLPGTQMSAEEPVTDK